MNQALVLLQMQYVPAISAQMKMSIVNRSLLHRVLCFHQQLRLRQGSLVKNRVISIRVLPIRR